MYMKQAVIYRGVKIMYILQAVFFYRVVYRTVFFYRVVYIIGCLLQSGQIMYIEQDGPVVQWTIAGYLKYTCLILAQANIRRAKLWTPIDDPGLSWIYLIYGKYACTY